MMTLEERNNLVQEYLPLVWHIIGKQSLQAWVRRCGGADDAYQEGVIGLIAAAEMFDPNRGVKFITYAWVSVVNTIKRAAINLGDIIYVPQNTIAEVVEAEVNKKQLRNQRLVGARQAMRVKRFPISRRHWKMIEPAAASVSEINANEEMQTCRERFRRAKARLHANYQKVLERRFPDEYKRPTLVEVGEEMGVSRERIRQIESRAIEKIRRTIRREDAFENCR